jgi:hypothetical protein
MHMCDIVLGISAILLVLSVTIFFITYKIGKNETKNRPCGGGRHNA